MTPYFSADIADTHSAIDNIGRIAAVPLILEAACHATGLHFATIARVTHDDWTACAVLDNIGFGMAVGDKLDIHMTMCDTVRRELRPVIIDDAQTDPVYSRHPVPAHYGIRGYISVPIQLSDGRFFGTLCALGPEPAHVSDAAVQRAFALYAQLIAREIESQEKLMRSEAALFDEQRVARLREQFVAVVSHDLRNPIASMEAGLAMLRKAALAERQQGIVEMMQGSCGRMKGIVSDILDFARGRMGSGIPVTIAPDVDLRAIVAQVVNEARLANPSREIGFSCDCPAIVAGDAGRLGQLASNLVANALAHSPPQTPVDVSLAEDAGELALCVRNAGDPIPPEIRAQLFQPFFRSPVGEASLGLGLGLYIVSEIAAAHKAKVDVQSDAQGICFRFGIAPSATA